ncbi:aminotransferase class III-fold pyridoxal phosphate-dependent enzyme [Rhizobium sp. SSA_523]|uniref:aminotransferase class III-fold pyridoxal phosphate-dependent enzyme n=1 Tax=Rhizobium sp. SSA_523 TaxID=2952477 RepID=UPI0020911D01|nr:aminotransferase class III-fold pyridoxal phosphate-dependent enzyme [Rhizobium sp. SSA_523]MCO5734543.1 aminotransferase class III-fold pyridoxal phosphate-dependent enzyme [Rhizobium sp. SSA_523]WKC23325.1 aminotransferase class III-fold pyridoxal phosphate-dependent enzyme [Rhizobium sp. SSA_523]
MADAPDQQPDDTRRDPIGPEDVASDLQPYDLLASNTGWPDPELFLASNYGLSGDIEPLATDPPVFLVRYEEVTSRLDYCESAELAQQFQTQASLLLHMRPDSGRIQGPHPLETNEGMLLCPFEETEEHREGYARVFALPPGDPAPATVSDDIFGAFAARLIRDLSAAFEEAFGEEPPVLHASLDLRQAGPTVVKILRDVEDTGVRDPIAKALVTALRQVQPLGQDLRTQLIHHRPVPTEVVGEVADEGDDETASGKLAGVWQPTAFTDPASLGEGWLVAALAGLAADILLRRADPLSILPAVRRFHAELPLTEAEIKALWPLTIVRLGLMRAATERDAVLGLLQDEAHLTDLRERFDAATAVSPAFMEAAIRDAVDWPRPSDPELERLLPELDPDQIRLVDLSAASTAFFEGNWEDPESDWKLLARIAWDTKMGATRFGEYRLSRSHQSTRAEAENYALHVDLCAPAGTVAVAPFGGMIRLEEGRMHLTSPEITLHLEGLDTILADGTALFPGDRLGVIAGAEGSVGGLRIRLCRSMSLDPPLFTSRSQVGLWRQLVLSPSLILGLDLDAPVAGEGHFIRGWRDQVFDAQGRPFLDLSGSAGLIGHGHAGLAETAYRQWLLLNGLGGTQAESEYQAALLQRLPGELDTVVAVTTEPLAMELAEQLADRVFSEGGPVIADERRTGFGRNGRSFWAFQEQNEPPDIVVTPTPVPGEPLAAVIMSRDRLPEGLSLPRPDASAVACRLGTYVIDALEEAGLMEQAQLTAAELHRRLDLLAQASDGRLAREGEGLSHDLLLEDRTAQAAADDLLRRGIAVLVAGENRISLIAPHCLSPARLDDLIDQLAEMMGISLPFLLPATAEEAENRMPLQEAEPAPI